jgi:drug/metabolite transporter (DMT)-like permease
MFSEMLFVSERHDFTSGSIAGGHTRQVARCSPTKASPEMIGCMTMTSRLFDSVAVNAGISIVGFGLAPLLKKIAIEGGVTPWMVSLVSACGAVIVSILILGRLSPQNIGQLFDRRHFMPLLIIGIVATGLVTLLAAIALSSTTATNRSLFLSAYPAATLLFAHLILGERLRPQQYVAIALLLVGLVGMNDSSAGLKFTQGFWLLLVTLPLIGLTDVYSKRLVSDIRPLVLATGRNLYGTLFIAVVALFVELGDQLSVGQAVALLVAGGCQGIAVWTLFRAFERSKASLVSSLVAASPFVTLSLEVTFLELRLTPVQWLGMFIVIASAIWLAQTGRSEST